MKLPPPPAPSRNFSGVCSCSWGDEGAWVLRLRFSDSPRRSRGAGGVV